MEAELTRLNHKIAIQLHLVAESCNTCNYDGETAKRFAKKACV